MIHINWLTDDQVKHAMENGEFETSLLDSKDNVAIVLTQNWCSQWVSLKKDLENNMNTHEIDLDVYMFEYNKSSLFRSFMDFKENSFQNHHIPYIRCYKNGIFVKDSNYIPTADIIKIFRT